VSTGEIADGAVRGEAAPAAGFPSGDIALKTITAANVANGTLRGGDDLTTANEIMDGTVTGFDIATDAVGRDELRAGAVSADKLLANAATGVTGGPGKVVTVSGPDAAEDSLASAVITPAGSGTADHMVLLTGQFQAVWQSGSDAVTIEWQVMDGTREIGPAYRTTLEPLQQTTGSVSFVDAQATEGVARTYTLRVAVDPGGVTSTREVRFLSDALTAVDLGRR